MTLQFEELNEVDMRSLWPHEAHDFTPWLANHLEHLSQTVGIPMELEGTEVSVRIHHLQKSGVGKIIFFINFGGIEHRKVLDSLDLFAKEVMPNFIE